MRTAPHPADIAQWATTPSRYLRISAFWFAISLFWSMMLGQVMQTCVERFFGKLHSGAAFALISTSGAVASAAIQLFIGPLSDRSRSRIGRRRPYLLAGSLAGAIAIVVFASVNSFPLLIASFVAIQISLNISTGPYQALIPDLTPRDHQGRASAFMGLMQLLGEAGGPILAGLALAEGARHTHAAVRVSLGVTSTHGAIRLLMFVCAGAIVLLTLLTAATVPDAPAAPDASDAPLNPFRDLGIRKHASFYWLLVSRTFYNLGFYVALDFLSYYCRDSLHLGETPARQTTQMYLMLVATLAALVGTFPAGFLADRVPKKRIVYVSCAFSAIAGLAFALAPNAAIAISMAAFFGLGFGVFRAVDWAFACNVLPQQGGAARWMAIWSLSQLAPQVLAPQFGPVSDAINRHLGLGAGWRAAMIASMVFVVVGAAFVSRVSEEPS